MEVGNDETRVAEFHCKKEHIVFVNNVFFLHILIPTRTPTLYQWKLSLNREVLKSHRRTLYSGSLKHYFFQEITC